MKGRLHVGGTGEPAAADNRFIGDVTEFPDGFHRRRHDTFSRHAAHAVGQHRGAVTFGVAGAHSVDGAKPVGACA